MDQAIVPFMLRLLASNLGATISTLLVLMLHFWAFAYYLHRGQRTMQASLERIEGSNERIALMVRELHNR